MRVYHSKIIEIIMDIQEISHQRLNNQCLTSQKKFKTPQEVVRWLGAVQSQDYPSAKWALGLRLPLGITDEDIEKAFNDGKILRTHLMRPTWHFITPEHIRWILALTAPRVKILMSHYNRRLNLDKNIFAQSQKVISKALQGGNDLTRPELAALLKKAGISAHPQSLGHIIMEAELDGIICSGARRGKHSTYALLDERVPKSKLFTREEALTELVKRYFTSHSPATLQDFSWWSGLTIADARQGIEKMKSQAKSEIINGKTYWSAKSLASASQKNNFPRVHLLPNYDEYIISYKDRSAIFDRAHQKKLGPRNHIFYHSIVMDGQIVGSWKRTSKKNSMLIETNIFVHLDTEGRSALATAIEQYSQFVGLPVNVIERK